MVLVIYYDKLIFKVMLYSNMHYDNLCVVLLKKLLYQKIFFICAVAHRQMFYSVASKIPHPIP